MICLSRCSGEDVKQNICTKKDRCLKHRNGLYKGQLVITPKDINKCNSFYGIAKENEI